MSRYRRSLAAGATYFFTLALEDRKSDLLVREIKRLRAAFQSIAERYPFENIATCVLPDHLHTIWQLPENDADFSFRLSLLKRCFSTGLPAAAKRTPSKSGKREKGIWQRRFWEHQIRDDLDLTRHVDYAHFNPVKHGYVAAVQDWPHSSFHRYVRDGLLSPDWGSAGEYDIRRVGE